MKKNATQTSRYDILVSMWWEIKASKWPRYDYPFSQNWMVNVTFRIAMRRELLLMEG